MTDESVNICTLHFEERLGLTQARLLRGAIVSLIGRDHELFHNHQQESGLRYGYPQVQYKSIDGHGAIVGIGDAVPDVINLASAFPRELQLGNRQVTLHVTDCHVEPYQPAFDLRPKLYALARYIPLNEANIKRYRSMLALTDKVSFIEDILTANILAFLKGIGYRAEQQISCAVTTMQEPREQDYKHVSFATFDLQFVSNIELPDGIGLGKSSSIGFGTLRRRPLPHRFNQLG